jgi:hypothetical protein
VEVGFCVWVGVGVEVEVGAGIEVDDEVTVGGSVVCVGNGVSVSTDGACMAGTVALPQPVRNNMKVIVMIFKVREDMIIAPLFLHWPPGRPDIIARMIRQSPDIRIAGALDGRVYIHDINIDIAITVG